MTDNKDNIEHSNTDNIDLESFMGESGGSGEFMCFRAPGRVNLIGGHTDYNDGFVLPVAIDRAVYLLARPRADRNVRVYSCNFGEKSQFHLDSIDYNKNIQWINYLQGVAYFLQENGCEFKGMDIVIRGEVPRGAGLSSSAALEMAAGCAFNHIYDLGLGPVELAHIARRAEKNFVGVSCGIMDQLISALGKKNHALFIDCRTLDFTPVRIEDLDYKILVANTRVEHSLADTAYNERQEQCERGVQYFDRWLNHPVKALRDVNIGELKKYEDRLPRIISSRCRHVIEENERVHDCRRALENDDLAAVGRLLIDSHRSLRDLYEVSCEELDLMVDLALEVEGVLGARMTGAGFGGSTVNLVHREAIEDFKEYAATGYQQKTGIEPEIHSCEIVSGCGRVEMTAQPGGEDFVCCSD